MDKLHSQKSCTPSLATRISEKCFWREIKVLYKRNLRKALYMYMSRFIECKGMIKVKHVIQTETLTYNFSSTIELIWCLLTFLSVFNVSFAMRRTKAGFAWNAKGQGTSGVATTRRHGPHWGIDAWTVAMKTDAIARPFAQWHWPKPVEKGKRKAGRRGNRGMKREGMNDYTNNLHGASCKRYTACQQHAKADPSGQARLRRAGS